MGRREKKTGKGRLDKYYKLAKEQGYRARSAFKLIQLDKKYGFLESARCCIDLCAAPGGWLQVASKNMPPNSVIVGIDLVPIKPIPRCITIAEDITTDVCKRRIRQEIKDWRADVVLHDGAPNVGTAWVQDAFTQAELVMASLRLAVDFLAPGGTFVTKIFRSKDYNSLLWVFNQLFKKVEATKPPSSRNVSAEIFVVCTGYLAPKRIDPKLLSNKHVFKDLDLVEAPAANASALDKLAPTAQNIFAPEKKRRRREGYAEGDYTLFHALPASDFVKAADPIDILGKASKFEFITDEDKALYAHPLTKPEIKALCADLRVIGKRDFKALLKWRSGLREDLGIDAKVAPVEEFTERVEMEEMDEDEQMQADLDRAEDEESAKRRRERRKANERKAKEVLKLQLSMGTPVELGMDRTDDAVFTGDVFDLQAVGGRAKALDDASDAEDEDAGPVIIPHVESESSDEDDDEARRLKDLEANMDQLYDDYQNRRLERDAKAKVKEDRRKKANQEGEWNGIGAGGSGEEEQAGSDEDEEESDDDLPARPPSDSDTDSEDDIPARPAQPAQPIVGQKRARDGKLITKLEKGFDNKATSRETAMWYDQPVFKGIEGLDQLLAPAASTSKLPEAAEPELDEDYGESEDELSVGETGAFDSEEDVEPVPVDAQGRRRPQREDLGLVTAEAMTLASQLVNGEKTKAQLMDDGFHRYAFNDKDGAPTWFTDDEMKHFRNNVPVTKEAVDALRAKMRALNARPIKKIAEAKARKRMRTARRLSRMQKRADVVNESADLTEREKADQINKMVSKASKDPKSKKREIKLVVAKGQNARNKGRPKGVKGRYKMVDSRMKKEMRATKRVEKHGASKKTNRRKK